MKKIKKKISENFHFLVVKFSIYFNRHVFVMSYMSLMYAIKSNDPKVYLGSTSVAK